MVKGQTKLVPRLIQILLEPIFIYVREVWPTDIEFFGALDCDPSDEEELLKSVFMENASLMVVREARYATEHGKLTACFGLCLHYLFSRVMK